MPALRKPTVINEAAGTYKKNPKRAAARATEPVVTASIGEPPSYWLPDANGFQDTRSKRLCAIWHDFLGEAAPGVLNRSHRAILELACELKYMMINRTAKTGDRSNYINCLRQMGMTPAAQSTVSAGAFEPTGSGTKIGRLAAEARRVG